HPLILILCLSLHLPQMWCELICIHAPVSKAAWLRVCLLFCVCVWCFCWESVLVVLCVCVVFLLGECACCSLCVVVFVCQCVCVCESMCWSSVVSSASVVPRQLVCLPCVCVYLTMKA